MKVANGTFMPGQIGATYTLTVTNIGAGPTSAAASVTDTLPSGLAATSIAGTGWTCVLATLTCTRSDVLAPSASYPPILLTVNIAANAPASLLNTATVSGGGETNTGNNAATTLTTVAATAAPASSIPTLSPVALVILSLLLLVLTRRMSAQLVRRKVSRDI